MPAFSVTPPATPDLSHVRHNVSTNSFEKLKAFCSRHVSLIHTVNGDASKSKLPMSRRLSIMAMQAAHTLRTRAEHMEIKIDNSISPYLKGKSYANRLANDIDHSAKVLPHNKTVQAQVKPDDCALCTGHLILLQTEFENLTISSNFRPYGHESWLVKPTQHVNQGEFHSMSSELFKLALELGSPYTFLNSGFRGNSQQHLHIHALKEGIPLREAIKNSALSPDHLKPTITYGQTTMQWMKGNLESKTEHFSGIHIKGHVLSEFTTTFNATLAELAKEYGEGGYNIAYWVDEISNMHSFIFPRDEQANSDIEPVPEKEFYGILELCGILLMAPTKPAEVGKPYERILATFQKREYTEYVVRANKEIQELSSEQWHNLKNRIDGYVVVSG